MSFCATNQKEALIKRITAQLSLLLFRSEDEVTRRIVESALRDYGIERDICQAIDLVVVSHKAHVSACIANGQNY